MQISPSPSMTGKNGQKEENNLEDAKKLQEEDAKGEKQSWVGSSHNNKTMRKSPTTSLEKQRKLFLFIRILKKKLAKPATVTDHNIASQN